MTAGVIVGIVVLIAATAFGVARRRSDGKLRALRQRPPGRGSSGQPRRSGGSPRPTWASRLGQRATLLQFSSSFCAPCRATRQILADVAGGAEGVAHVEIDVADRMDLVRQLDVRRTPTTFLLGPDGRVASRASGPPRKADVLAALGEVA